MPSSTSDRPQVDVSELYNALWGDAAGTIADLVVLGFDWCSESAATLHPLQKAKLLEAALLEGEKLRAKFARTLVDILEHDGITTRGLDEDIAKLLGREES